MIKEAVLGLVFIFPIFAQTPNYGHTLSQPRVSSGTPSNPKPLISSRHDSFQFLYSLLKIDEFRLKKMNPKFFSSLPTQEQENRTRTLESLIRNAEYQWTRLSEELKSNDDLIGLFSTIKNPSQMPINRALLYDRLTDAGLPEHQIKITELELKTYWYKKWRQPGSAPKPYSELTAAEHSDLLQELRVLKFKKILKQRVQVAIEKIK